MTDDEAAKLVAVALAGCPAQAARIDGDQTEAMIATWRELLDDLPYRTADAALRVLLQTRSWLPSVADVRATAAELVRGPVKPGGEAWGSVVRAMRAQGAHRTPGVDFVFRDPLTARCVASLDWRELCLSENTVADRARFIELYDQLASQDRREATSPLLAAAIEQRTRELENAGDAVRRLLTQGGAP